MLFRSTSVNVGIGTTAPTAKLHVQASGNDIYATFSENDPGGADGYKLQVAPGSGTSTTRIGQLQLNFGGGVNIRNQRNAPTAFLTSDLERMRITGTGSVGIGTTAPTARLEVSGGDVKVSGGGKFVGDGSGLTSLPAQNGLGTLILINAAGSNGLSLPRYLSPGNIRVVESGSSMLMPAACTIRNLYVSWNASPAGSTTGFWFMKNGITTLMQCAIANGGSSCSDTFNTVSLAAGDTISVQVSGPASLPAAISGALSVKISMQCN